MATAISLGHIKVYRTSRSTHWLYGGLVIFLSATEIWSVIEIWSWLHAGPAPRQPVATLIFALCVPFLIVLFVKSMRARLIITAEGILLDEGRRPQSASWKSLGPFEVIARQGRYGQVLLGSAQVINLDRPKAHAGTFVISDIFGTPMETLVAEINAARAEALGPLGAAIVAQEMERP